MLELNRLYHMCCHEGMAQIPDKFFGLAITDPPYGRREHGGKNRSGLATQKNGSKLYVKAPMYEKKSWDTEPPNREYFDELFRVSRNQIIWGANYYPDNYGPGRIVWDKCNDGSDQSSCEIAYCSLMSRVDMFRFMWRGMLQGKSVSEGHIQQGDKRLNERRIHPAQKPVALYAWLLQTYAKPGDKILDTHVGSGSSLIACYDAGHDYMGFEIDADYFTKATERIERHKAQQRLFEPGQVVMENA